MGSPLTHLTTSIYAASTPVQGDAAVFDIVIVLILGTILAVILLGMTMCVSLLRRRRRRQTGQHNTETEQIDVDPWAAAADRVTPFDTGQVFDGVFF